MSDCLHSGEQGKKVYFYNRTRSTPAPRLRGACSGRKIGMPQF